MSLQINLSDRQFAALAASTVIVFILLGMVGAYNEPAGAGVPMIVGHSVDELNLSPLYINWTTGRVGIGTASPSVPLDIVTTGNTVVYITAGASNIAAFWLKAGTHQYRYLHSGGDNTFRIQYDGSSKLLMTSDGKVTIGSADIPLSGLDVDGNAVIGAGYAGTSAAPSNGLLVQGKVGIGTITPGEALDVVGNIAASGTICDSVGCIGAGGGTIWDSGWFGCSIGGTYPDDLSGGVFPNGDHNLGTESLVITLLFKPTPTGVVSVMMFRDKDTNVAIGSTVKSITSTTLKVQVGANDVFQGLDATGNYDTNYDSGYCKVVASATGGGSGGLWSQTGSDIYYDTGKVGIGTTTPSDPLEVYKDQNAFTRIILNNPSTEASAGVNLRLKQGTTTVADNSYIFNSNTYVVKAIETGSSLILGANNYDNIEVASTGKINVRTTLNAITGSNVDVSNINLFLRNPADDNNEAIGIGFGLSANAANVGAAIIHERKGSQSYGKLHFATKQSGQGTGADIAIRMSIDDTGNVGIGTTSPQDVTSNSDLTITGTIAQDSWTAPTLTNGWVNYAPNYNPAGYFRDKNGIVHLRGMVRSGTIGAAIFTLPAGYRPEYRELHAVQTSLNVIGRADITTTGEVLAQSGSNTWFSLDGITFRASGY